MKENFQSIRIVKIGGNVLDHSDNLQQFLSDFAALPGLKLLVHGGGKIASEIGKKLGIEPKMHEGRRITDEETLNLVTMVYAGLINKNLVADLQMLNCNALGLSGADADIITANIRPVKEIDFGYVGDIKDGGVQAKNLQKLLENGFVPVIAPITHNGQGQLLNTNADTIASSLAIALSAYYSTELIYCFEKKGVLMDVNDDNSVISEINPSKFQALRAEGKISDGMIPKLDNALAAIEKGVGAVRIMHSAEIELLIAGSEPGTVLKK